MAGVPAGRGIRLDDAGAGHAVVARTWRPAAGWAASAQVLPHMELDTGMRAVVQRVSAAMVAVDGAIVGQIGRGLVVLVGVTHGDGEPEVEWLAEKLATLRIFEDQDGKMNASVQDTGGAALVVSQFTLYADARRGRRPSFTAAAPPEQAAPLVQRLTAALSRRGIPTASGQFGAHMDVALHNDGPVTIILETPAR